MTPSPHAVTLAELLAQILTHDSNWHELLPTAERLIHELKMEGLMIVPIPDNGFTEEV